MNEQEPSKPATPNGTVVVARDVNGNEVNVTEGVQALYDLVISSMDWGSGFWTVDDAAPVLKIAQTCGFAGFEEAQRYVDDQRQSDEQRAFLQSRRVQSGWPGRPHDHVFSTVGRCMWPSCKETESAPVVVDE